jgi:hypothetical protein
MVNHSAAYSAYYQQMQWQRDYFAQLAQRASNPPPPRTAAPDSTQPPT